MLDIEVNLVPHTSKYQSAPGRAYNLTAALDPKTGELLEVNQPYYAITGGFQVIEEPMTRFPQGLDRLIPHPDDSSPGTGFSDDFQRTYIREVVPFSLQWPLASGDDNWGGLQVSANQKDGKWVVNGTASCHRDCWYQDASLEEFYVYMEGEENQIFPTVMKWGRVNDDQMVWATLENSSGGNIQLNPVQPFRGGVDEVQCGLLPCEPEGWPSRLSFQYAFDFLEVAPQWIAWSTGKDVSLLSAFQGPSDPSGGQLMVGEPILWGMKFVDHETGVSKRFSMISMRTGDLATPPVLYREGDEVKEFQSDYTPFASWEGVGLNDAYDWLSQGNKSIDEIAFVNLYSFADRLAPDPDFQLRVTLGASDETGVQWVAGSGYSGALFEFGPINE